MKKLLLLFVVVSNSICMSDSDNLYGLIKQRESAVKDFSTRKFDDLRKTLINNINNILGSKSKLLDSKKSKTSSKKQPVFVGGSQGIHDWDSCLNNSKVVHDLVNQIAEILGISNVSEVEITQEARKMLLEELPKFSVLPKNKEIFVANILSTLESNKSVLGSSLGIVKIYKLNYLVEMIEKKSKNADLEKFLNNNLENIVKQTIQLLIYHAESSKNEVIVEKEVGSLLKDGTISKDQIDQYKKSRLEELNKGDLLKVQLRLLINILPALINNKLIDKSIILNALLDNTTMGGWCAPGYRNRLYENIMMVWDSNIMAWGNL